MTNENAMPNTIDLSTLHVRSVSARVNPCELAPGGYSVDVTLTQLANVLALRSERESFFTIGALTNLPMLLAVGVTAVLQVLLLYVPALQALFKTQPLTVLELALCLGLASLSFWVVEATKWVRRRRPAR